MSSRWEIVKKYLANRRFAPTRWQIIKEYLDDAGFQPSKYIIAPSGAVGLPRRWFWAIVLICCLFLLGVFCYSRVLYFYSYPFTVVTSVDDKIIPIPQAVLCPFQKDPIMIPGPHVYANMSDTEVALTATIKYGLPLLDTQSREEVLDINQTTLEFLRQIPSADARQLVNYYNGIFFSAPEVKKQLTEIGLIQDHFSFVKAPATAAILNRLKEITNSAISFTPDTMYQLFHKFSLVTQLSKINCLFLSDFINTNDTVNGDKDCRKHFRPVVLFNEICIQLKEIDGKQLLFNKTRRAADSHSLGVTFEGFPGTSSDKIVLFLTHNDEFLSLTGWSDLNSGTQASINEVRTTLRLSQPYHEDTCTTYDTDNDYGKCVTDCIFDADFGNCTFYFGVLSDEFDDPYRIPKKEDGELTSSDKPLCSISEQIDQSGFTLYNARKERCYNSCPVSCSATSMRYDLLQSGPRQACNGACKLYQYIIQLSQPQIYISHIIYTEIPLYDEGALLAELGGTMGLFLGASIFTLVHLVEFLYLHIVMPVWEKVCGCKKKTVKIKPKTTKLAVAAAAAMSNRAAMPNRATIYND